ncbi:MAG: 4-hydroxy-3-methylbut-2-enyl diphosphate reductase [Actinobacteria bacterium]|nr:4-hydroxy-3-methylbut-2-enyl diphosphate reductase [Actinomycetota bacterium]
MTGKEKKILIAAPRGWCAGVDRAVEIVELALERYGAPVYVRKQIVHNLHVVKSLEAKGAVFVESEEEVPEGAICVFSAHGVSPEVHANALKRNLKVIDATCPLVTKVHVEAKRFAAQGRTIFLIGHEGHEEIEGTSGEAPEQTVVVESPEQAYEIEVPDPEKVAFISQTTLAVDDTKQVVDALRKKYPLISGPTKDDICYASQNRQEAVKAMAERADVVFVVGSENSSNSNRLVEVAKEAGAKSWLIADETSIDSSWVDDADVIGISSGASTPEVLVERVVAFLADRGIVEVEEIEVAREDVHFPVPPELLESAVKPQ